MGIIVNGNVFFSFQPINSLNQRRVKYFSKKDLHNSTISLINTFKNQFMAERKLLIHITLKVHYFAMLSTFKNLCLAARRLQIHITFKVQYLTMLSTFKNQYKAARKLYIHITQKVQYFDMLSTFKNQCKAARRLPKLDNLEGPVFSYVEHL